MHKDENQAGASNPQDQVNDQIKGELLATFAVLKSTYGLERLELAWLVIMSLENHVRRYEGLEDWVRFTGKLSELSKETLSEIDDILEADAKTRKQLH